MSRVLKAAVIGAGSMGRRHARVYAELDETALMAVADVSAENGESAAAQHGGRAYKDFHEMLRAERPDLVTVAVPTSDHREVAEAALAAGAHVLVEKPIAATVEEAQALICAARAAGRKLMVGHIVRFDPTIRALKQHLDAGELGRIFQIVCRRIGPFPSRIRDVGVVVDLAPHDLDVMRYLTGENPLRLYAETQQQIHTDHEDLLTALLRFPSGVTGMLEINWLTPTKVRDVIVLGEQGMFRADCLLQELTFHENAEANGEMWDALRPLKGVSEGRMTRYPLQHYEPLKAELAAFAAAVANDTAVPVSGEDGLAALKLALALVQSGVEQRLVEVG
jgi:UDP-N-acetylglucosamine 3-dehydrogenase